MASWLRFLLITLAACVLATLSASAALPGAGSPLRPGETYPAASHAWAVLPASGGRGYVLVHLPPRVASDGRHGALPGSIRSGFRLEEAPEAMAAFGERVYLFFRPKPRGDDQHSSQRAVFTQGVRRFAQSELWVDEPSGRLETLAAIPDAGDLLAAAADERGPIALVQSDGVASLLALRGERWERVELPPDVENAVRGRTGPAALAVEGNTLAIAARVRGGLFVASTNAASLRSHMEGERPGDVAAQAGGQAIEPAAERTAADPREVQRPTWIASLHAAPGLDELSADHRLVLSMGRWSVVDKSDAAQMTIWTLTGNSLTKLCTFGVPNLVRTATGQLGSGRWIVISANTSSPREPLTGFAQDAPTRVTEVSLLTGHIFYDDRIQPASPLGTNEFRFLAVVLMLAMAMVLVLVLRGQPDAVHLPEGFAFAEPVRRIIAGVLDIALVSLLLPRIVGYGLFDLFNPQAWVSGDAIRVLVALAAGGALVGTLSEWLFGRTPGKLMTDCEVISVVPPPAGAEDASVSRPSLPACVVRNAVKWFLSPVAMLALLDDTGRHRGDQMARAAVVVEIPDDDETDEEPVD